MNKIFFKIFFCLLFSSQLDAQTFIHLKDIESEFSRLERNYLVQSKAIKLNSDLFSTYDSCQIHVLYKIVDTNIVSKDIPRVNCFCKNGDKKSGYPPSIAKLLTQISADIDSPIVIVNKDEISSSGEIYLGAITTTFDN